MSKLVTSLVLSPTLSLWNEEILLILSSSLLHAYYNSIFPLHVYSQEGLCFLFSLSISHSLLSVSALTTHPPVINTPATVSYPCFAANVITFSHSYKQGVFV